MPVSFIMPAYNCASTVIESLRSICEDNCGPNDEIIVVDDCSVDETPTILANFARHVPCTHIIRHQHNRGGGAARNTAIQAAKHNLIFNLDSDNVLVPGSIARLVALHERTRTSLCFWQSIKFFKDSVTNVIEDVSAKWRFHESSFQFEEFLRNTNIPASSGNYLFTRDSWQRAGGFPEHSGALDTWGFGLRLAANGEAASLLRDSFYLHRLHEDSYWARFSKGSNPNRVALQLLVPYLDRIHPLDVTYLFSSEGRDSWMDQLVQRPLHVNDAIDGDESSQLHAEPINPSPICIGHRLESIATDASTEFAGEDSIIPSNRQHNGQANDKLMTDDIILRQTLNSEYWNAIDGDHTLRLDYDLQRESIVFDLGGYRGDWTQQIYQRYGCRIFIFEPVPDFARNIADRFRGNDNIVVCPFALGPSTGELRLTLHDNATSIFSSVGGPVIRAETRNFTDFLSEQNLEGIDLLKINIEGREFALLDYLLANGHIPAIRHIQVQFHNLVPDAQVRVEEIRRSLWQTHFLTYSLDWIWDSWSRIDDFDKLDVTSALRWHQEAHQVLSALAAVHQNEALRLTELLVGERDALKSEGAALRAERDGLLGERDGLRAERDGLLRERDGLLSERDALRAERDGLLSERDGLLSERDGLRAERDALQSERDGLRAERDTLQSERDGLRAERDTLQIERDALRHTIDTWRRRLRWALWVRRRLRELLARHMT